MNNKNILLLGGNGFIGKNLQMFLTKHCIKYYVSDLSLKNDLQIDLSDKTKIFKLINVLQHVTDIVILACTVNSKQYINFPNKSYLQNTQNFSENI